ncbi:MAG: ProQ activator of osmoprotectant transporter prop [Rhodocyclaceae bacterium]|nr:ProQ activator of osmoprotectant transporter prop [Rhodocyclaceae bacterium]
MNTDPAALTDPADAVQAGSERSPKTALDPRALLERLQADSPTFRDCKPVALRIDKAIGERYADADRKAVRAAMRIHTASTRYLKALEKGTLRYDLDGNADGGVTEEHRSHAAQTLKERFAEATRRKREKQKQEEAQRREQEAEQRRAEKLQQLVGKFGRGS